MTTQIPLSFVNLDMDNFRPTDNEILKRNRRLSATTADSRISFIVVPSLDDVSTIRRLLSC